MAADDYNYESFGRAFREESKHFSGGPAPGQLAPDFALPVAGGGERAFVEFKRETGVAIDAMSRLLSKLRPII